MKTYYSFTILMLMGIYLSMIAAETDLAEEKAVKAYRDVMDLPPVTDPGHPFHDLFMSMLTGKLSVSSIQMNLTNATHDVSPQCKQDVDSLISRIEEKWPLYFFDAWGKPTPGIATGSLKWLGAYDQCIGLSSPLMNETISNKTDYQFVGRYCNVGIGQLHSSSKDDDLKAFIPGMEGMQTLFYGVCFPDSCTVLDIGIYFDTVLFKVIPTYKYGVVAVQCQPTSKESLPLSNPAIGMISLLSFLGVFIVLGTAYDVLFYQRKVSNTTTSLKKIPEEANVSDGEPGLAANNTHLRVEDYTPLVQDQQNEEVKANLNRTMALPTYCRILRCFSFTNNGTIILDTIKVSTVTNIDCIHGIRFLSMSWVIFGHTFLLPIFYMRIGFLALLSFSVHNNGKKLLSVSSSAKQNAVMLQAVHGIRFLSMAWVILGHTYYFAVKPNLTSFICQVLLCFSVSSNGLKILKTGTRSNVPSLEAVHGIRFFSMTWVILGHSYAFAISTFGNYVQNPLEAFKIIQRFTFQALTGATVSVDTFFLLSGTLVSYLALREMRAKSGPKGINWFLYYFHRFWRLTPPYMLVLGCYAALFAYLGSGPLWPQGTTIDPNCNSTWWTNLLYVNNLVKPDKMCMAWSWYLANDMQFFVITPLILIPMYFSGIAGVIVTLTLMLGSFIATGVIASKHHYLPMAAMFSPLPASPEYINYTQKDNFNDIYIPPYTRIGPYLVGVLLGYILYVTDRKVKMHWLVTLTGWIIATVIGMSVVYGMYGVTKGTSGLNYHVGAFFITVHRSAWGLAVAWVIFACVTGYGGFVNTILSWSALVPLSRLTYMAYLVHPIVIFMCMLCLRQPIIYTDFTLIYLFLGNLVLSYMVAFVVSLVFESPMMGLEKIIFKRKRD